MLYLISYNTLPSLTHTIGWLIGASASVMAIVIAIAVKAPYYRLNLLLVGFVSLKWIAIIYVLIDFLSINGENMGGHIAHLGGALTGFLFITLLKRGIDITNPINAVCDFFANSKNHLHNISFKRNIQSKSYNRNRPHTHSERTSSMSKEDEQTLDIILDKIKKSGYSSLTEDEKRRLFQVSNNK